MSWKLLTETDLNTGEKLRYFQYRGEDGEYILPEWLAIDLLQRLVGTFPQILEGLRATAPEPRTRKPLPMFREEDDDEEMSSPLRIPDDIPEQAASPLQGSKAGDGEFTLLRKFAPERDAPQG